MNVKQMTLHKLSFLIASNNSIIKIVLLSLIYDCLFIKTSPAVSWLQRFVFKMGGLKIALIILFTSGHAVRVDSRAFPPKQ